ARTTHVANRIERVSVLNRALADFLESQVKLGARHRKCQMLVSLRAERRQLEYEAWRHANHRERRALAFSFIAKAQDLSVKRDALRTDVDVENNVVELWCHWRKLLSMVLDFGVSGAPARHPEVGLVHGYHGILLLGVALAECDKPIYSISR